jgi:replication factor C subunit 3/5
MPLIYLNAYKYKNTLDKILFFSFYFLIFYFILKMFVYDYTPRRLDDLSYNQDLSALLKNYAQFADEQSHMIFNGILHSGKRTRAYCYLREVFGEDVYDLRKNEVKIEGVSFYYYASLYHFEIPLNQEINDKSWIYHFLKEIIETQNVLEQHNKYIVITNAEKLNLVSQQMLRRMMEVSLAKFIFITENGNQLIEPIRSRCIFLRVPAPSKQDIFNILDHIIQTVDLKIPKGLSKQKIIENIITMSGKYRWCIPDLFLSIQLLEMKFIEGEYKNCGLEWLGLMQLLHKKVEDLVANENFEAMIELREMCYDYWIHQISFQQMAQYLGTQYLYRMNTANAEIEDNKKIELVEILNNYFSYTRINRENIAFEDFLWNFVQWLHSVRKTAAPHEQVSAVVKKGKK